MGQYLIEGTIFPESIRKVSEMCGTAFIPRSTDDQVLGEQRTVKKRKLAISRCCVCILRKQKTKGALNMF